MKSNLDEILTKLGVKYIHLIYDGFDFEEQISREYDETYLPFFCEISWGSGDDNYPVMFQIHDNGFTPGEALQKCIDYFFHLLKEESTIGAYAREVAKAYNIKV